MRETKKVGLSINECSPEESIWFIQVFLSLERKLFKDNKI